MRGETGKCERRMMKPQKGGQKSLTGPARERAQWNERVEDTRAQQPVRGKGEIYLENGIDGGQRKTDKQETQGVGGDKTHENEEYRIKKDCMSCM